MSLPYLVTKTPGYQSLLRKKLGGALYPDVFVTKTGIK